MAAFNPDIEKLEAAMAAGLRQRSPLMVWFIEHHDEFSALLDKHGADWKGLARHFAEMGLMSKAGKPLTPRTVENYWHRAQQQVAKKRVGHKATAPADQTMPAVGTAFAAPAEGGSNAPAVTVAHAGPAEPKFKPAKMRNEGRGVTDAERRALGDPTAPADPHDPRWTSSKLR
jgi:hypothetical protein